MKKILVFASVIAATLAIWGCGSYKDQKERIKVGPGGAAALLGKESSTGGQTENGSAYTYIAEDEATKQSRAEFEKFMEGTAQNATERAKEISDLNVEVKDKKITVHVNVKDADKDQALIFDGLVDKKILVLTAEDSKWTLKVRCLDASSTCLKRSMLLQKDNEVFAGMLSRQDVAVLELGAPKVNDKEDSSTELQKTGTIVSSSIHLGGSKFALNMKIDGKNLTVSGELLKVQKDLELEVGGDSNIKSAVLRKNVGGGVIQVALKTSDKKEVIVNARLESIQLRTKKKVPGPGPQGNDDV